VNPAIKLEPLEGAEPKLKVAVLLPALWVMPSDPSLSVAVSFTDLAASLEMRRVLEQCVVAAVNSQNVTTSKN
jgi:hypothetical protein